MDRDEVLRRFKADILKPVLDFASINLDRKGQIVFHDPFGAETIFDDSICRFERGNVDVELLSIRHKGLTFWTPDSENGRHEVAMEVDPDKFFDHYFSIVK